MDCRLYQKRVNTSVSLSALLLWVALVMPFSLNAQDNNQQRWRDSLSVINKLIAASQWSTDLHLRKANANLELKQWEYAIEEYKLVLSREPRNPAALFYRAYAYTHMRRLDLASNDLNDLLVYFPHHFEARLSLAIVLQHMGKRQEALDQLNQTVEQHADSAVAYAARANVERQMKLDDAALYDWQRAEQLDPRNPLYVASHADHLIILERREEARRILDAAVQRGVPKGMLLEWYGKAKR